MNNDYWNYLVSCDYASKISGGNNKKQKRSKESYSLKDWICAVIAAIIVLTFFLWCDS